MNLNVFLETANIYLTRLHPQLAFFCFVVVTVAVVVVYLFIYFYFLFLFIYVLLLFFSLYARQRIELVVSSIVYERALLF